MSTVLSPQLSVKNKYYISKHRYYELKHFCLQYPEWKDELKNLGVDIRNANFIEDPTGETATRLAYLERNIRLVQYVADSTDEALSVYIFRAVTEERSFANLKTVLDIPCGKDLYYDRYRRFFWLLDKER